MQFLQEADRWGGRKSTQTMVGHLQHTSSGREQRLSGVLRSARIWLIPSHHFSSWVCHSWVAIRRPTTAINRWSQKVDHLNARQVITCRPHSNFRHQIMCRRIRSLNCPHGEAVFSEGKFPMRYKTASITPLPKKKGDRRSMRRRCFISWTFGVRGTTYKWIESYLDGRSQFVRVGDRTSAPVLCKFGVPQGSVGLLGPLLFTIYISPISNVIAQFKNVNHA